MKGDTIRRLSCKMYKVFFLMSINFYEFLRKSLQQMGLVVTKIDRVSTTEVSVNDFTNNGEESTCTLKMLD